LFVGASGDGDPGGLGIVRERAVGEEDFLQLGPDVLWVRGGLKQTMLTFDD
jgi:hypothetical protein